MLNLAIKSVTRMTSAFDKSQGSGFDTRHTVCLIHHVTCKDLWTFDFDYFTQASVPPNKCTYKILQFRLCITLTLSMISTPSPVGTTPTCTSSELWESSESWIKQCRLYYVHVCIKHKHVLLVCTHTLLFQFLGLNLFFFLLHHRSGQNTHLPLVFLILQTLHNILMPHITQRTVVNSKNLLSFRA